MALSTFAELKSSIADFLNRDDLTSVIPDFIKLAETDFNRKIRHWRMENRASAEVDGQYSAIPADFLEPIRLHIETGDYRPVELISHHQLRQRREASLDTSGKPAFYAFTQGEIELYPTPDATYSLELYYYSRISALSDSNTNNWLLTYFPDAYLYGSLIHSAPYLAEDQRITTWASLYAAAVQAINEESNQAKYGGAGLRMKIRSY
jgi:hypothetical protein